MSDLPDLELPPALSLPLTGSHLIEASAGSGKTFTLVALFVRLILEKGLKVDQILTVTFTRAATAELRQRVRRRLIECKEALAGHNHEPIAMALVQGERALIETRLREAIALIDSAPIYTIHGFAQRALADRAFSAGTSFEVELVDTTDVWAEAMRDFWRSNVVHQNAASTASSATHQRLVKEMIKNDSVDLWLKWMKPLRTARPLRTERIERRPIIDVEAFDQLHQHTAMLWQHGRLEFERFMLTCTGLNRGSYNKKNVPSWCAVLDRYFAGPAGFENFTALTRFSTEGVRDKSKSADIALPQHPMLEAIDRYLALRDETWLGLMSWRQDLLISCFEEVPVLVARRLAKEQRLGFDDQMVRLLELLDRPRGAALADALRARYPAALIDEFQDTDALQERIFSAIYGDAANSALFLVGDPKQAIYRFRGADIFTYLAAAGRAGHRHALVQNFRSTNTLVAALNALYHDHDNPFLHRAIEYRKADAAGLVVEALLDDGRTDHAPLRFLVPEESSDSSNKAELIDQAASAVAHEIADMLLRAATGRLSFGGRPLRASDVAVLVNSNVQGGMIRRALRRVGVGAADRSRGNVFESEEAEWLQLLLAAIAEPHRAARIINVLATPLFGVSASELQQLGEDEITWQAMLDAFQLYREVWSRGGVMRLLRLLLAQMPGTARLAASASGERHLTNLFHLAELIHENSHDGVGLSAQLAWLSERREHGLADPEQGELRLESDQNLVQVMTVHKSKGLEFPVVFVPFMFAGREAGKAKPAGFKDGPVAFHDSAVVNAPLVIDFGGPQYAEALRHRADEERAEEARVLYVALTRAIYRCVVFWDATSKSDHAALTGLIEPLALRDSAGSSRASVRRRLESLSVQHDGVVGVFKPLPQPERLPATSSAMDARLAAREVEQSVVQPWSMSSFTGLLRRRIVSAELSEGSDHDQDVDSSPPEVAATDTATLPLRFTFQRGAAAGECLHDVLERIDFDVSLVEQRGRVGAILRHHGFPAREAPALGHWMQQVLDTPLDGAHLCLSSITARAQIREMEFHLPMTSAAIARIAPLARRHGIAVPHFAEPRIEGFLKGFIDLVVVVDHRTYLLDYKSNWLGPRFADYRGERLEEAMRTGGYHLQYLLYSVALVRWMRWRDPGFDYERDFGGVFYLFLRGMGGDSAEAKPGDGVFTMRPPKQLIDALDGLFSGGSPDLVEGS